MPVTTDIVATYTGPRRVVARILAMGPREDRALAILMGGCMLVFTSQMPRLAREAHITGQELNMLLGGALFGWIFIAPLLLYSLAWVSYLVVRVCGGKGDSYGARLALFWALLAASPLMLLNGLTAGFIGPGPALSLVGGLWLALFLWFWISGLMQAYWNAQ
ncbi:MAG: YIP1 family protein [Rhodobacteraceae bacterium]|nr:YIP1 family protein [Paracoccaceae bacterium]